MPIGQRLTRGAKAVSAGGRQPIEAVQILAVELHAVRDQLLAVLIVEAAAVSVVQPAVVDTAQPTILNASVAQVRPAVGAMNTEQSRPSLLIAKRLRRIEVFAGIQDALLFHGKGEVLIAADEIIDQTIRKRSRFFRSE